VPLPRPTPSPAFDRAAITAIIRDLASVALTADAADRQTRRIVEGLEAAGLPLSGEQGDGK
jgi:hypothetical protein